MPNCLICDHEWEINSSRDNKHIYCRMCRTSEKQIDYGHRDPCIPWNGEFDEYDQPMLNGQIHMPGERICNHRDCVQPSHIMILKPDPMELSWQELELERLSIFYRTNRKQTWDELMATLEKEKPLTSRAQAKMSESNDNLSKIA